MAEAPPTIALEIGSAAVVELTTERQFRRRIQDGTLGREKLVTVYRGSDAGEVMRARDVPELGSIFFELLGPELGSVGSDTRVEAPDILSSTVVADERAGDQTPNFEEAPAGVPIEDVVAVEKSIAEEGPQSVSPPSLAASDSPVEDSHRSTNRPGIVVPLALPKLRSKSPTSGRLALAGLAMGVLFIILWATGRKAGPTAAVAAEQVEYVTRTVKVRSAPSGGAQQVAVLRRGEQVSGAWVVADDGVTRFLKISDGPYSGNYVWSRNLANQSPPALTSSPSATQVAMTASDIHAQPNDSSPSVGSLAANESVFTTGTTADGWAEVALIKGGVGYVRLQAFQAPTATAPPPAANQSAVADGSTAAPPAAVPAAPVVAVPSAPLVTNATRYVCAFDAQHSVNPLPGTGDLIFTVDESRSCVNNRSIYLRNDNGALSKAALVDKESRISALILSQDRQTFIRQDYTLNPAEYSIDRGASVLLTTLTCPAPGDAQGAANVRAQLIPVMNFLGTRLARMPFSRRTIWHCSVQTP